MSHIFCSPTYHSITLRVPPHSTPSNNFSVCVEGALCIYTENIPSSHNCFVVEDRLIIPNIFCILRHFHEENEVSFTDHEENIYEITDHGSIQITVHEDKIIAITYYGENLEQITDHENCMRVTYLGAMAIIEIGTPRLNPLNPSPIHSMAIAAPLLEHVIKPIPIIMAADTGIANTNKCRIYMRANVFTNNKKRFRYMKDNLYVNEIILIIIMRYLRVYKSIQRKRLPIGSEDELYFVGVCYYFKYVLSLLGYSLV